MNVNFTINGVEVAMEMPCYGPDLFRINSENPAGMKDALRELVNVVNDQLPAAVQDMGEQIGNALDGGGGGAVDGDKVWVDVIQNGGAVPADLQFGLGPVAAATLVVHSANFNGAGATPPDTTPPGPAPSPTAVLVVQDVPIDPRRHVVSQTKVWVEPTGGDYAMLRWGRVTTKFYKDGVNDRKMNVVLLSGPEAHDTVNVAVEYTIGKTYPNCLVNEVYPIWEIVVGGVKAYACWGPYGVYGAPVGTIMLLDQSAALPDGWEVVQVGAFLALHADAPSPFTDGTSGGNLTHYHGIPITRNAAHGAEVDIVDGVSTDPSSSPTDLPPFSTYRLIRRIDNAT